jgi:endonuclease YncB( thermonuclease family)
MPRRSSTPIRIPRRLTPRSALTTLLSLLMIWALNTFQTKAAPPSSPRARAEVNANLPSHGTINRVVDGDTLEVNFDGAMERIRLIGIDTPEKRPSKRASLQSERSHRSLAAIMELGEQASRAMQEIARPGLAVTVEYDAQPRDKYNRLLGYVFTSDGLMVNEEIVKRGYAQLLTIPPNVKYVSRFQRALQESRDARRGLWAEGGFSN